MRIRDGSTIREALPAHRRTALGEDAGGDRSAISARPVPRVSAGARPAAFIVGLLLAVVYSRAIELVPVRGIALSSMIAAVAYGLATTRVQDWMSPRPTLILFLFSAWMLPTAVFGLWKWGSLMLMANWSRSVMVYLIVLMVVRNRDGLSRLMGGAAWGAVGIVLLVLATPVYEFGRLGAGTNTLSNANDFATFLLIGLPLCVWYSMDVRRPWPLRLVMAAGALVGVIAVFRTGSRGGLITAGVMVVVVLVLAHGNARVALAAAAALLAVIGFIMVPREILQRYETMLSGSELKDERPDLAAAIGSSDERKQQLRNSLRVTLDNPLMGVGPGNYTTANAQLTRRFGHRAVWLGSHNAFTQVSSECGIPGAVLFTWLIVHCFRRIGRLRNPPRGSSDEGPIRAMALALTLSLAAYTTCAMFASIAYVLHLPLLAAFTVALERCAAEASAGSRMA